MKKRRHLCPGVAAAPFGSGLLLGAFYSAQSANLTSGSELASVRRRTLFREALHPEVLAGRKRIEPGRREHDRASVGVALSGDEAFAFEHGHEAVDHVGASDAEERTELAHRGRRRPLGDEDEGFELAR